MANPGTLRPHRLPAENEVHVWTVFVSEYSQLLNELQCLLSPEEVRIAVRFVYSTDRVRYTVAHGVMRRLLGEYLSLPPAELIFAIGEFGKPALALGCGESPLRFNMSHSGDVIVFGFALNREVGVDVEAVRSDIELMDLAGSQFSKDEARALRKLDPVEQVDAFFRIWTRKEAYLKARGEGLGFPLDRFTVSLEKVDRPAVLWVEDDPDASETWSMFQLQPAPGYAGAVVVQGRPIELITYHAL